MVFITKPSRVFAIDASTQNPRHSSVSECSWGRRVEWICKSFDENTLSCFKETLILLFHFFDVCTFWAWSFPTWVDATTWCHFVLFKKNRSVMPCIWGIEFYWINTGILTFQSVWGQNIAHIWPLNAFSMCAHITSNLMCYTHSAIFELQPTLPLSLPIVRTSVWVMEIS